MGPKQLRAEQIEASRKIRRFTNWYEVPSQSGPHWYKVVVRDGRSCTCEDFELTGRDCKHILACDLLACTDDRPKPEAVIRRKTYRQDWPRYNASQCAEKDCVLELLADLCATTPEPEPKKGRGRKPLPLRVATFAAVYKQYVGFSARRFTCDLEEAERRGHIARSAHFNSVLNALENQALTPILYRLITTSALPLKAVESTVAVDSTGFRANRYEHWLDRKWGRPRAEATWVKLHALVGTKTNVVISASILDQHSGDSPQFRPLVDAAASANFQPQIITADKAYCSADNFDAAAEHGAALFSPFKPNATGGAGGLFEKAFHFFSLHREQFLPIYHQRSNIEATFSALKRKIGELVRSKTDVAQRNEVLAKVVAYNLTCLVAAWHELGIAAEFQPKTCTFENEPAQVLRFPGA